MEEMYKYVKERLDNKKQEYADLSGQFDIMATNESKTGCFERNGINDLVVMSQVKAAIQELEQLELYMRARLKK